jgi:lysozyme family protein
MANYQTAFNWLMESEDAQCSCAIVPDAPPGAHAISGINSAAFPQDFQRISGMDQKYRLLAVFQFYKSHFWNQWLDRVDSDELAKRVFDASVNMGEGTAVKLLQSVLWPSQVPDGLWGALTVASANKADPDTIVSGFKAARVQHYVNIAKAIKYDAQYLNAWLARAEK